MREAGLPRTYETLNFVRNAFTTHLDTIIRRYKKSKESLPIQLQAKSKMRRQTRQNQVFFALLSPKTSHDSLFSSS
jgi:hypothetical protein